MQSHPAQVAHQEQPRGPCVCVCVCRDVNINISQEIAVVIRFIVDLRLTYIHIWCQVGTAHVQIGKVLVYFQNA